MQLDKTHIVIRERSFLDLMDLALVVIRVYFSPLAILLLCGVIPMLAINTFLLWGWLDEILERNVVGQVEGDSVSGLFSILILLVVVEAPLATAPLTVFLGQAMFEAQPRLPAVWKTLGELFPQVVRGPFLVRLLLVSPALVLAVAPDLSFAPLFVTALVLTMIVLIYLLGTRPYLSEVILLERNPWRKRAGQRGVTTAQRNRALHRLNSGDLFGRWLLSLVLGSVMTAALWISIGLLRQVLFNAAEYDFWMWILVLPLAIWMVVGYFSMVRFLSYIDLRIRTEGWEVELNLRAEAARLKRQLA